MNQQSDGCCVNFDDMFTGVLGQSLTATVEEMLEIADSFVCKTRIGSDSDKAQTCGYTWIQGVFF
ncbi:MAG: hypothetical protein AB8B56_10675 [Crocinitomicaceae bacterium]